MTEQLIFGEIFTTFPDGSYIKMADGSERSTKDPREINLVLVRLLFATGSGMQILHAGEEWFLPFPVTRGAREAMPNELAAAPAWARQAYQWYTAK